MVRRSLLARTTNTLRTKAVEQRKKIWIGAVEVRAGRGGSDILGATKGAFVNIVTWAADAEQYRHNVEQLIGSLGGLVVSDVLNSEPVDKRRARTGKQFDEEIEDLISRAQANSKAILYGSFHLFDKDDA
jgi:hypothetical protein